MDLSGWGGVLHRAGVRGRCYASDGVPLVHKLFGADKDKDGEDSRCVLLSETATFMTIRSGQ